jgi:uncharacterized protein (UPF0248 family)
MLASHELLLKYWYDRRFEFSSVRVYYVDRGAPNDRSWVSGSDIGMLDSYYIEIISESGTKYVPYHRIRTITYAGEIVWGKQAFVRKGEKR